MNQHLFLVVATTLLVSSVNAGNNLCVAENGGHGETPPPMGSTTVVNTTSFEKTLVAGDLEDPVWVDSDGKNRDQSR